jgi:hypothetical protein
MTEQEQQFWQAYGALQMRQYETERKLRMLESRVNSDEPDATLAFLTGAIITLVLVWLLRRFTSDDDAEVTEPKRRRRIEPVA